MAAKQAESDKAAAQATSLPGNGVANPPPETTTAPVEAAAEDEGPLANGDLVGKVAIAGVIGVGAALIEASLIPGIIIGAAAILAPKVLPEVGIRLRPLFKSTIRGAYKLTEKTREAFAEAHEHVQDIMAEARHEDQEEAAAAKASSETIAAPKA
jgi:Protein of unknown function (DUF5132)